MPGYWDVAGTWHDNDPEAEARVRAALAEAQPATGAGAIEVVWGDGPIELVLTDDGRPLDEGLVTLALEDGPTQHFDVAGMAALTIEGPHPPGYHVVSIYLDHPSEARTVPVIVAPERVCGPADGERSWGVFAPLYAMWHADGTAPSIADLDRLGRLIAEHGGSIVATLPLLATFLGEPGEPFSPSPYTPASRLHWNELFADLAAASPPPESPPGPTFDYAATSAAVIAALDGLGGDDVTDGAPDRQVDAGIAAYAAFRAGDGPTRSRHELAQQLVRDQLTQLGKGFRARGQRLYLDLPVGSHPDGFDTRQHPHLFAPGIAVGAPPDAFFGEGQNWGFPPLQPCDPESVWHVRDVVRTHMAVAGMLRVDHVMGLYRLYWVPEGLSATQGVYVRYPFEALLAVLSVESHRYDCWVVGEDLGTVPDEVREAMARHGLLGMWVAEFEADSWWGGRPLAPPAGCVASVDTHDTPPFAAWLADRDPEADPVGTHAGVIGALATSPAQVVLVTVADLFGDPEPQNVPGTPAERPNWVHRLPMPLDDLADAPELTGVLSTLGRARPRPPAARAPVPGAEDPTDA